MLWKSFFFQFQKKIFFPSSPKKNRRLLDFGKGFSYRSYKRNPYQNPKVGDFFLGELGKNIFFETEKNTFS